MRRIISTAAFVAVLALCASSTSAQNFFKLDPPQPQPNMGFSVSIEEAEAGEIQDLQWLPVAIKDSIQIANAAAGLPEAVVALREKVLRVSSAVPNTTYQIDIKFKKGDKLFSAGLVILFDDSSSGTLQRRPKAASAVSEKPAEKPAVRPADKPADKLADNSADSKPVISDFFELAPNPPVPGQSLTISIRPADAGVISGHEWKVSALDNATADNLAIQDAGIPSADSLKQATLKITQVRPDTTYQIRLTFDRNQRKEEARLSLGFDAQRLTSGRADSPQGAVAQPEASKKPTEEPKPPATSTPALGNAETLKELQDQLRVAKEWAEKIAQFEKTDDLIIGVEYFEAELSKTRDTKNIANEPVKMNLKRAMDAPLMDALSFAKAVENVTAKVAADADIADVETAWATEKRKMIESLVDQNSEAQGTANMWNEFLDDWQAEVKRVAPERFRDALVEAPLIVTGILLNYERDHIRNAMTGGGTVGVPMTSTSGAGYYYYSPSHAAVHHARAMSRIEVRHHRKMSRIVVGY